MLTLASRSVVWSPPHTDLCQTVNSRYCVFLLCVLAVTHVVIVHVFFYDTLQCFCPTYYTTNQCEIYKAHCRTTKNAVYEDDPETRLRAKNEWTPRAHSIPTYYQYVSLILLLQAMLFYVSTILERQLVTKLSGVMTDEVALSALNALRTTNHLDKEAAIQDVAQHISLYCTQQVRRRHVSYALWWLQGNKVVISELVSKVVCIVNVFGQFFMLDVFLGMPFHRYGLQIMGHNAFHSTEVFSSSVLGLEDVSGISNIQDVLKKQNVKAKTSLQLNWTLVQFPTSGVCDFAIRQYGSVYHSTLQCLMPVNTLNELIFSFLWFLMLAVAVVTVASFLVSLYNVVFFHSRRMAVREMLQDTGVLASRGDVTDREENGESDMDLVGLFEDGYLRRDGLFLLDIIQAAAGDVMTGEVLKLVWSNYKENLCNLGMLATRIRYKERWTDEPGQITVNNTSSTAMVDTQETFIPVNSQVSVETESCTI